MGFFKRLFKGSQPVEKEQEQVTSPPSESEEWTALPGYLPASPDDYERVSVIATAIAAGDRPDSQFVVKRILQRNPEAVTVSLIASSLVSVDQPDSQLLVKHIYRKK